MLEKDLVQECQIVAEAMGAFLAHVGQRRAKGSGTSRGFPDLVLLCNGEVRLIELKRPATPENPKGFLSLAQSCFIARAHEMGVEVEVVDNVADFCRIVNACRASRGVRRAEA